MIDLALRVLIVGLGAWRLGSLLVHEDGPWDVFERIRRFVGLRPGEEIEGMWAKLLACMWCCTPWVASGLWALSYVRPILAALPAAWAVAILAERWQGWDRK